MKPTGLHTPRPTSLRAASSSSVSRPGAAASVRSVSSKRSDSNSGGSSSADSKPEKIVAKCLDYDLTATSPEFDFSPRELPDPTDLSLEIAAVADESPEILQVPMTPSLSLSRSDAEITDSNAEVADTDITDRLLKVLTEIEEARDVSGGTKQLLSALVEAAIGELGAHRGPRAPTFWAKVRIGLIGLMVAAVAAADVALAVASWGATTGGGTAEYGLPPT